MLSGCSGGQMSRDPSGARGREWAGDRAFYCPPQSPPVLSVAFSRGKMTSVTAGLQKNTEGT
jgi:hypothetical protein